MSASPEPGPLTLPERVTRLEDRVDAVENDLSDLRQAIRDSERMLSSRMDSLGRDLGGKVDGIRQDVYQALITAARSVTPQFMWTVTTILGVAMLVVGIVLGKHV